MARHFFLIDCNQFFVSCELVFQPQLRNKPVIVLSNNDGCVVSRSKEAKAIGIPMGAPAFECRALCERERVAVFSSNFALYADMSARVMNVLRHFSPDIEEYSIDEAFLLLEMENPYPYALEIRKRVYQWTGIPISIGIGPTKTLAKVASDLAKNMPDGVCQLTEPETIAKQLQSLPVQEVWGIGRRIAKSLHSKGVFSAFEFSQKEDLWIRTHFSVILLRTALELRGTPCFSIEECPAPRQSILSSRSFGKSVTEKADLLEAAADYTTKAAEKLRSENSCASLVYAFVTTSRFIDAPYSNGASFTLPEATDYTPTFIHHAKRIIESLYIPGLIYKKVGVMLAGITPRAAHQLDLLHKAPRDKRRQAMEIMDSVNQAYGNKTLVFAAEGIEKTWKVKREKCSAEYSTRWDEILTISI